MRDGRTHGQKKKQKQKSYRNIVLDRFSRPTDLSSGRFGRWRGLNVFSATDDTIAELHGATNFTGLSSSAKGGDAHAALLGEKAEQLANYKNELKHVGEKPVSSKTGVAPTQPQGLQAGNTWSTIRLHGDSSQGGGGRGGERGTDG